jgi:Flp pilus assembly protein protease CpaA
MFIAGHIVAISALVVGSVQDLKTREIPDWLSYGLIAAGIFLSASASVVTQSWAPIVEGLAGLAIGLLIGVAMFYTGQWGGGDSKLVMGLSAVIGLSVLELRNAFLVGLLLNILLVGAVYGLCWTGYLAVKHRRAFLKEYQRLRRSDRVLRVRKVHYALLLIGLLLVFAAPTELRLSILILLVLIFFMLHLWMFVRAVEQSCMVKRYPVGKLTEGDWIVKRVMVKGERICGPRDLGISKEQIRRLQRLQVKHVLVKEGIPFVPSFLVAYLLTLWTGNWFMYLMP